MSTEPFEFDDVMKQVRGLPLRLEIAALGEALQIGERVECQRVAFRLIEIAGYGWGSGDQRALGPIGLMVGLGDRWRARHSDWALRVLALGWGRLNPEIRGLGLSLGRGRWLAAVKGLAVDADPEVRKTAVDIAMDTGDPGFGVMVCTMLGDGHQKVRLAADRALIGLVLGMFGHLDDEMLGEAYVAIRDRELNVMHGDPAVLELERCEMLGAIADAAWSFASHRCRSPLLASLLLMDRRGGTSIERRAFEKMRRLLNERNHPSHMPMRTVLRTTPAPILRERALRWLVVGPISGVAGARLEIAESMAEHCAVLDQMHLCIRPLRSKALGRVRIASHQEDGRVVIESRAPMLSSEAYASLGSGSKRGYIRWVTRLEMDGVNRRRELEQVMADRDPMVRLHGCCVADSLDLVDYLYDECDCVARHAGLRWSSVGGGAPSIGSASWERRMQTGRLNSRSGSSWVRRVAGEEVERLSLDMPESPASRLAGRRFFQNDPAGFVRLVREMLHQPARRGRGLGVILALGLESRFEMDLVSLAGEAGLDERVRASLVRGLSSIDSEGACRAVLECLESNDQRVIANAIESGHTPIEVLVEYKGDANHRVRSSAIRRLLVRCADESIVDGAVVDLLLMLRDGRADHRLAGVWATQRVIESKAGGRLSGWRELVGTLDEMTRDERDDGVRARADQCVHRLLVSQRSRELEGSV